VRFSRRQLRERLRVGNSQLKVHLRRLVDAELVLVHRATHGTGVVYSLAFDDSGEEAYVDAGSGFGRDTAGSRPAGGRASAGPGSRAQSRVSASTCTGEPAHRTENDASREPSNAATPHVRTVEEVG
jgi:hypothetical protein